MEDITCGKGWGIGTNIHINSMASYGYPENDNPFLFLPDHECCTQSELKNWHKSCEKWKKYGIIVYNSGKKD